MYRLLVKHAGSYIRKNAPVLWGFPEKFLARMDQVHTKVDLVAGD